MTFKEPGCPYPLAHPAEAIDISAAKTPERAAELTALKDGLREAIDSLADMDEVNSHLAMVDDRLVIDESASVMVISSPLEIADLNNFILHISTFGERIPVDEDTVGAPRRRPPTDNDKSNYLTLALDGRESYDRFCEVAEMLGYDKPRTRDRWLLDFFHREANVRAYVLFQPLMDTILAKCLNNSEISSDNPAREEIFAAYSLASRLVAAEDRDTLIKDGSIDEWTLCR